MSSAVVQPRLIVLLTLVLILSTALAGQSPRKSIGWPSQIVLVRDELTPAGSLGHLLVNGKPVGVTLEPHGEKAQITVSRARLHHSVAENKEDYAIVLNDLDDGDSGSKLQFHLGNADDQSEGCVLIGTRYEAAVMTENITTAAGKRLLQEINQEKAAGKSIEYEVEGNTLHLKTVKPVHTEEALATLRRALYGANTPGEKDLLVNFDFQASDEYKAEVLGISESIARQLTIDERQFVIKALEVGSEGSGSSATGTTNSSPTPTGPGAATLGVDPKSQTNTKLVPQKPGDEPDSVEQGFKRSAEPDQPTTLDNKPTPPPQQTDKKKEPPQ
jgi:hypothetical protein